MFIFGSVTASHVTTDVTKVNFLRLSDFAPDVCRPGYRPDPNERCVGLYSRRFGELAPEPTYLVVSVGRIY